MTGHCGRSTWTVSTLHSSLAEVAAAERVGRALSGHLHFGRAAEPRAVEVRLRRETLRLTLDFGHALFIDCSYAQALRELAQHARKQGVTVRAVGLQDRALSDFTRFGLRDVIAV